MDRISQGVLKINFCINKTALIINKKIDEQINRWS